MKVIFLILLITNFAFGIEGEPPSDKGAFFKEIYQAIQTNKVKLRKILLKVNNIPGTDVEFDIVERQLKNISGMELYNLNHTPILNNVAVYPATNVPLYTLVSHGIIPVSISKNVWFRTPEMTRTIYKELYDAIVEALPPGRLDGLHVLVEPQEVQYENFNKFYVLGLNKKGTRVERPPAEMVIFTGNPKTSSTILEGNIDKINRMGNKLQAFKQVFITFGAGINPIIITKSAAKNLRSVIHWSLEPIRINTGQDCLVADFYVVHESIVKPFIANLIRHIKKMKPAMDHNDETEDPNATFSPLTLSRQLDHLIKYKEDYKDYLVNKDAYIDIPKRLVSPHVFLFPISSFGKVTIQEHFAPFYSIFTYRGAQDLKKIALNPVVQKKAMYATIFGGNIASEDIKEAKEIFMKNRHIVRVNENLFGDLNANLPFGGKGSDASRITTIKFKPDEKMIVNTGNYPTLISSEAYRVFGTKSIEPPSPIKTKDYYIKRLNEIIKNAQISPSQNKDLPLQWQNFKFPTQDRIRGVENLREIIEKTGLCILIGGKSLTASRNTPAEKLKLFYGAPVIPITENKTNETCANGIVLQNAGISNMVIFANSPIGRIKPQNGWGTLNGLLGSKLAEYETTEAIWPSVMPQTEQLIHLIEENQIDPEVSLLLQKIKDNLQKPSGNFASIQPDLINLVETLFSSLRKKYPEGVFFKNFGEFGTGDFGTQITSFTTSPKSITSEFLRRFEAVKVKNGKSILKNPKALNEAMKADSWEMGTAFINALIFETDRILIQGRVNIGKTEMGFPKEFRVDFLDGEPVLSRIRYGTEYLPEETEQAKNIIRQFFKNSPKEFRYLSGGADVVKLTDGNWKIIEFNYGSASGTLHPQYFPIEANRFIAGLTGKPTKWLIQLEEIFHKDIGEQKKYLKLFKNDKLIFWRNRFEDITIPDVGKWFRDRYLEEWSKNPTAETGIETLNKIKKLFEDVVSPDNEDIQRLIKSSELYINRKLRKASPP